MVLIAFPNLAEALARYDSPDYHPAERARTLQTEAGRAHRST
ncbi:DUF1330 domain-containing protein [Streptomyces sp. NPDC101733]